MINTLKVQRCTAQNLDCFLRLSPQRNRLRQETHGRAEEIRTWWSAPAARLGNKSLSERENEQKVNVPKTGPGYTGPGLGIKLAQFPHEFFLVE